MIASASTAQKRVALTHGAGPAITMPAHGDRDPATGAETAATLGVEPGRIARTLSLRINDQPH